MLLHLRTLHVLLRQHGAPAAAAAAAALLAACGASQATCSACGRACLTTSKVRDTDIGLRLLVVFRTVYSSVQIHVDCCR